MATWTPRSAVRGGVPWGAAFKDQDPVGLPWGRRVRSMASSYVSSTAPPPQSSSDTDKPQHLRLHPLLESQLAANGELTVVERLNTLLDTGQFADVNVRVGKGTEQTVFKAHRLLLATASQPLYKLIYAVNPNPGPNDITTIRVTDVDPNSFKRVLKYIYTDDVSIESINDAFSLLKASKKWGLKDMETKTLEVIKRFLEDFDPSTDEHKNELCELLAVIESQKNGIMDKCLQVMVKYANQIIPCQGFLNLEEHLIRKLLAHPDFRYSDILTLFESIRDWGMNQILLKNLKPSQLQPIVSDLLNLINLSGINDADFINTVLPSDCLGKADIIAFFMTRGMEIPRDLVFNNNKQSSLLNSDGSVMEFNKCCRFRRGYKMQENQIYLEHELRFRCSKNIRLLGVVFGFLFSNTDMGITIHCQGPWETVQWTDIIQSYCRVAWEKMQTADIRLMYAEPVRIIANQSYKILVKVGRMSCGSSEVDLWGGENGLGSLPAKDVNFYFLKAAVDPNKEVEESETDNKPGMITDILYQIDDDQDAKVETKRVRQRPKPAEEQEPTSPQIDTTVNRRPRMRSPPSFMRKRPSVVALDDNKPFESSNPVRRRISAKSPVESPKSPDYPPTTRFRPSQDSIGTLYRRPSTTGNENEVSSYYLRPPSKTDTSSYPYSTSFMSKDSRRPSGVSSNLSSSSVRETTRSRFGDSSSSRRDSSVSRFSHEPSSTSTSNLSRFGSSTTRSSFSDSTSRFGRESSVSKPSRDYTPSIYRRDSARDSIGTSSYSSRFNPTSTGTSSTYTGYSSGASRFSSSFARR